MVRGVEIDGSSVVVMFPGGNTGRKCPVAANDDAPKDHDRTVTVRTKLDKSGVAIKVKVPVREFTGVAVSTRISEDGVLTSAIELIHPDSALSYKVFEEEGNQNVVAEWQNWGRKLRLPLFIRTGDGGLMAYSQQVNGVLMGSETGRRRLADESERRPRFLHRRKPGNTELA